MLPTLCVGIASLNPCFNGRYSQSLRRWRNWEDCKSLNPCFNGRYSQSATQRVDKRHQRVVLILVLMEDTLRAFVREEKKKATKCLNPCFNGRYSQRGS